MIITEMQTAQAMTAADLYESLLRGNTPLILDVRNPDDFARWHVEGRSTLSVQNIPYYDFIEDADAAIAKLPQDQEILVVCAKEGSSQYVAVLLREHGIAASYLAGGILCWGNHYDTRTIASASWGRIIQIARPARGDLSFMIVSAGAGAQIIRKLMQERGVASVEELFALAQELGVRMVVCDMSRELLGVSDAELIDGLEVGGVATFLGDAARAKVTLFI